MPRHPEITISLRSRHPLAMVAAVRLALRRAGLDAPTIEAFSAEALGTDDPDAQRRVCADWVRWETTPRADTGPEPRVPSGS